MTALPRPTRRGALVAVAGLGLILVGAQTGFVDAVRAGIFALLLVVLALVMVALTGRLPVRLVRSGPTRQLVAGDEATVALAVTRPRSLPLAESSLTEANSFSASVSRIPLHDAENRGGYSVAVPHRGVLRSGPATVVTRDALGLAYRRLPLAGQASWTVWPRVHDHASHRPWARGFDETIGASAHPVHQGDPGAGTRAYVRGDDLRLVHWPATARRGELIVRQLDPPVRQSMTITLVGDVGSADTDPTWEALIEECATTLTLAHESNLPFTLAVGDAHTARHDEAMDLLAEVGDAPATSHAASLAFVHTSAPDLPEPLPDGVAYAVATGPNARALDDLEDRLIEAGWSVTRVDPRSSAPTGIPRHDQRGAIA